MQTRLYRLRSWIQRNRKLILVLAVNALIPVVIRQSGFYIKAENLLAHPAPLPDFIVGIGLKEHGGYQEMCIGICGPRASLFEMPESVALYLDDGFPLADGGIYPTNPLDFCWTGNFDGLHVARLEVRFATIGTSNYTWAFVSGPSEAGNFVFEMQNPFYRAAPYCK